MNKVILIGRVGKDVETKEFDNGTFVSNFFVATSEKFKNKSGEYKEKTEWHNIVIWNSVFAKQYIKKGDLILIDGKITSRSYETQTGEKKYFTEISANRIDGLAKSNPTGNPATAQMTQNTSPQFDENGDEFPF